ncbi:MAG: hypothetical protein JW941_01075 [Candidatus Coatesbacteria bacterium]|nr:hypothetical protein [Candidatus Coatesbacteria bacterium]
MLIQKSSSLNIVLISALFLLFSSLAIGFEIESYRNYNHNYIVSSQAGSVAIGTFCGTLAWDGMELAELSTSTGASFSQTCATDIAPDGSVWMGGWQVARLADGEIYNFAEFSGGYGIAAISRDEAWVIGTIPGNPWDHLFHIVGTEVNPVSTEGFPYELIVDRSGNVFYAANGIERYDEHSGTFIDCKEFETGLYQFSRDLSGVVYAGSEQGLWMFDEDEWIKLDDGSIWGPFPYGPNGFNFNANGTLWAYASAGLLRRNRGGDELIITEACGISLVYDPDDQATYRYGVWGVAPLGGESILIATRTDGLILFDGIDFSHIGFPDGPPENVIMDVVEDFQGRDWIATDHPSIYGTGYKEGDAWKYFRPEGVFGNAGIIAACGDTEGAIHVLQYPFRLITFDGVEFSFQEGYDHGVTDCIAETLEPGPDGEIWACVGPDYTSDFSGVVRIKDDVWDVYPTGSIFGPGIGGREAPTLAIASNDEIWVILDSLISIFDGENWRVDQLPEPLPFADVGVASVVFDLQQRLVFFTQAGVYRLDEGSWKELSSEMTTFGAFDANGDLWFLAYDSMRRYSVISMKQDGSVAEFHQSDGLAGTRLYSITIDHNGDKWVGTSGGLSRLEDGGPAQQSIALSAAENPVGTLKLAADLTNAGEIIPVSLWLACEYNGNIFYYPNWGPEPSPLNLTLSASSCRTEELVNIDTSLLTPGDYTFYAGISLFGGMDLLIGPRDGKVAIASYHVD